MAVEMEDRVEAQAGDRLVKLELDVRHLQSDVQHLQADVTEMKADARQFRSEVYARFEKLEGKVDVGFEKVHDRLAALHTQMVRGDLQTRIWMLVSMGGVLAVLARGFKWI